MSKSCATILAVIIVIVILEVEECVAVKKFYKSRPLKFRYSVQDQETSATKHKDEHPRKDTKHEETSEKSYYEENEADSEEEGDEGYEKKHGSKKKTKGSLDKEYHKRKKADGFERDNKDEDVHEHSEAKHEGKKAEKFEKFDQNSKYQKGHSISGEHSIEKKDDYEKKQDFFDESYEDDAKEKYGEEKADRGAKDNRHSESGIESRASGKGEKFEQGKRIHGKSHHRDISHNIDDELRRRYQHAAKQANYGLGKIWFHVS